MTTKWKCEDDILCGVNRIKNENEMSDLEKKHQIKITAPKKVKKNEPFEVHLEVGMGIDHPNEAAHFIEWIELYSGDTYLGRASFSGGASYPKAVFKVKLSHAHGPLKAWEKCNIHGLWENVADIEVTE